MRAFVYTRGLGTPTASQHNMFDSEKLKVFLVLLTGFQPSTFGISSPTLKPLSQPVTRLSVLILYKGNE